MTAARRDSAGAFLLGCALLLAGCGGGGGITPIRTSFNKGVYHYSNAEYDLAISEFRAAVGQNPDDHRARFNLGAALEAQAAETDEPERSALRAEAEQTYRECVARQPDDLRALVNLAAIEHERGETSAAEMRLREGIDANPGAALPLYSLGVLLMIDGRLDEAERMLREAAQVDPGSVEAHTALGACLERLDQPEDARAAYLAAIRADSTDISALLALGRLELAQDNPKDAAAALRQLLYLDDDHRAAQLALADALERAGDLEGATHHLWRARELEHQRPAHEQPPDYSSRLQSLYTRLMAREETAPAQ